MKRLLFICAVAIMATGGLLSSCSKSSNKSAMQYVPFRMQGDENWGMIGKGGKILFKDEFEQLPSACYEGVFSVKGKNGYTLYAASEKPKAIAGCTDLKDAARMSEGLMPIVRKGERISFIDKNGKQKFVLNPHKGKEIVAASIFQCNRALIKSDEDKFGFIDKSGKVVIEPVYDEASEFSEDLCFVGKSVKSKNGEEKTEYTILNKDGKKIKKLASDMKPACTVFKFGKSLVNIGSSKSRRYAFLDKNGEVVRKLPSEVKDVIDWNDEMYIYVDENGLCGLKNMKDETLIRAKYDYLQLMDNGNLVAKKSNKCLIIDKTDEEIKSFDDYENLYYISDLEILLGKVSNGESYFDKCEILSVKGEKLSQDLFEISQYAKTTVESDFFDVASIVKKLASLITSEGIGKVKIGDSMTKYLDGSPYSYSGETQATIPIFEVGIENLNKVDLQFFVGSSAPITHDKYSTSYYYGYSYSSYAGQEFNPNAKVSYASLSCGIDASDAPTVAEKICKSLNTEMQSKGFKTEQSGKYSFLLKSKNSYSLIIPVAGGNEAGLLIYLMSSDYTSKDNLSKIIKDAEEEYEKAKENYGEEDSDVVDEVEIATEIVVETATEAPFIED